MNINIEPLNVEELIELNKKIISRIKDLRAQEQLKVAAQFRIGDLVSFQNRDHLKITGVIISVRKAKISILTENNERWDVSPALLTPEEAPSKKLLKLFEDMLLKSVRVSVGKR